MFGRCVNKDKGYSKEDLYAGGMLDKAAMEGPLPEEFFSQIMEDTLKNDPEVVFNKNRLDVGGVITTHCGLMDVTSDPVSVSYGARNVLPPSFKIKTFRRS